MSKQEWNYTENTTALADTGDYETIVQFTNGLDCLQSDGDEMEVEELKTFCHLLNKMPDLWSHKLDATEFENSQLKKQVEILKNACEWSKEQFKKLADEGRYPEFMLSQNGGEGIMPLVNAINLVTDAQ